MRINPSVPMFSYVRRKSGYPDDSAHAEKERPAGCMEEEAPRTVFISNGIVLDMSHTRYYLDVLNIDFTEKISAEKIDESARQMRSKVTKSEKRGNALTYREVQSARLFLLDQWRYSAFRN